MISATRSLRGKVSAKIVSNILGHSDVQIALDTYFIQKSATSGNPLRDVAAQLLPDVMKSAHLPEQVFIRKDLEPMSGVEPLTY